jgi:UDP-sugar pyrophosphorylase
MDGWAPSIPAGESFELGTAEYTNTEKIGIKELGSVGFVLVAGGLGERLGYNGAKIGLPTESTTGSKYIQYYCEYIRAVESKSGTKKRLPLCIMVSKDTKAKTAELLSENKCFGLKARQITLITQGDGVPALANNDAKIVLDENDACKIETKPHGHGDIHSLLYKNGVTRKWEANYGVKWIVMFQDTNGLAFHTLPLMLGVSEKRGFIMNSLAVPRKANQAIGGIAKLKNSETGEERYVLALFSRSATQPMQCTEEQQIHHITSEDSFR